MTFKSDDELWQQVRECFVCDDGSLPTIEIQNLKPDEVAKVYQGVRDGTRIASDDACFWDLTSEQERALDDVENPGALVAAGKAAPFHFAIDGVGGAGSSVPTIGVHVFQGSVALDYRMGNDWGKQQVWQFFVWLRHLLPRTGAAVLALGDERPPAGDALVSALETFLSDPSDPSSDPERP
jgi:hypothetical protein